MSALVVGVFAAALGAQELALPDWSLRNVGARPAPRHSHAMAWDAGRERVVLFGGRNGNFEFDTTWEFDGTAWTQRLPAHVPTARFDAGMAYDRARQRIVMFGGSSSGYLGDTWEWDGIDWTQRFPAHAPSPRRLHTMTFDEARGVTVLFGGSLGAPGTWTYDGVDWTLHAVTDPGSREGAAAVYSPYTHRVLLFGGNLGGQLQNDLWQWDGAAWTALPQSGVQPIPAVYHAMAYDRTLGGIVLHGGGGNWFWNGSWQALTGTTPLGRSSGGLVHMDSQRRCLLFGGARPTLPYPTIVELDDHWETTFAARQLAYGAGCGAPPLALLPSPTPPRLGFTWQPTIANVPANPGLAWLSLGLSRTTFAGGPLPLSLAAVGMPGCDLLQDTAFAFALATTPMPGGATFALPIPPVPALAGYRLYAQALAAAPGVNALGLVVSGGLTVVIGE